MEGHSVDSHGHKRVLEGINVDNKIKLPGKPFSRSYKREYLGAHRLFFDGDNVRFVDLAVSLDEGPNVLKN